MLQLNSLAKNETMLGIPVRLLSFKLKFQLNSSVAKT